MKRLNITGLLRIYIIDLLRGTHILKAFRELKVQQYYSKEQLEEIKTAKFNRIFSIAKKSAPYYKDCKSYEDLEILTKDKIRKHFSEMVSTIYRKKIYKKPTGGSTGTPLTYLITTTTQSHHWAGILLSWDVAGYKLGDKVAFIAGTSLFRSSFKHDVFYKLLNIEIYSTYTLNNENILSYIKRLQKTRAKIIYGYATAVDIIATYINKNGPFFFPHLKGIVCTAEVMTEKNRENIERAFHVKVFNQYGCGEAGVSAFECEHQHMHLIDVDCKYEVDDEGNLLAFNLMNEAFIIMKYFTGDRIEFETENNCACKRHFPVLKNIEGRSYDIVTDSNNKVLHAAFFNILFRPDESIKQFQILFDKKTITIYLNVDYSLNKNGCYEKYLDIIKKHLFFHEYKLVINAPFLRSENAKHRYVINTES
jgi:phenylacetate-CoA ligase